MHLTVPDDLSVSIKSGRLSGKKIAICGGGGIAAIELPRIAREFRRHGAQVRFVVSENCLRFVGRESLEWASAKEVTVTPSGFAEHICTDDALLVFPATADLIGKISSGICCDGVTTLVQSALGLKKPVVFCTTMHNSLASSPFVEANIKTLFAQENISFVQPRLEEGKQKAPSPDLLVLEFCHAYWRHTNFKGQPVPRIAVTYGGTRAAIDPVRCISNLSSGQMGAHLIEALYAEGVEVTGFEAAVSTSVPALTHLTLHRVPDFHDFHRALSLVKKEDFDGIFHIAAVSDYVPETPITTKLDSSKPELNVFLKASPKMVELPGLKAIKFKAGCKLTSADEKEGIEVAHKFMERLNLDVVLWNQAKKSLQMNNQDHEGVVLHRENNAVSKISLKGKAEIADFLVRCFLQSKGKK